MNKPDITICTVNYNSSDFIGLMLYSFKKLTSSTYKVIIQDNNSNVRDYEKLKKIIKDNNYSNVELYRTELNLVGSLAHGTALNELVSKISTTYGVIMDADAVFLTKNWDKILISKINNNLPIFGTQADTFSNKPKDFPLMFAVCFLTDTLRNLSIDFRPKDMDKFQDTGWELRDKYLKAGLSGGLLYDFNTRYFKKGPFSPIVCSEYYLSPEADGDVFASHFGRGSAPNSKNLLKVKGGKSFLSKVINFVLKYPNIIKWYFDKRKWIKICQNIINSQ